ncbi:MAG: hypothetical protein IPL61_29265 [Myxococcales bacterium]|nr:hypothetical protein [Myxococcales bacterium]
MAGAIVLVAACGGSPKPTVVGASSSSPPLDRTSDPDLAVASLDEAFAVLAKGDALQVTCFAWSDSARTAACAVDASSIQGGATAAVRFVGAQPGEHVYYRHPDDQQFFDYDLARIDHDALAAARAALTAGGYQPFGFRGVALEPGGQIELGAWTLRRTRAEVGTDGDGVTGAWPVSTDRIEVRCGEQWTALDLSEESFANTIEPAAIAAIVTPAQQLVLTASVSWGIEGDSGGATDVAVIDRPCER